MSGIVWTFCIIFSVIVWHKKDVQICLQPSVCDPQYQFDQLSPATSSDDRDHFFCKLSDKLFRSTSLSSRKTLMKTLSSSLNTIVCYCLFTQQCVTVTCHVEQLFVPVWSKMILLQNFISSFTVHTFTPNFVYSFEISWKMLDNS